MIWEFIKPFSSKDLQNDSLPNSLIKSVMKNLLFEYNKLLILSMAKKFGNISKTVNLKIEIG